MLEMVLGGVRYHLDPAAISALRYRAEYGDSIANHLISCKTAREEESRLLHICWMMIPPMERPELLDFARQARRDGGFVGKARRCVGVLLDDDHQMPKSEEPSGRRFDEYEVVAVMAAAGMDMALIFELPIMHLAAIAYRYFKMQDPEEKEYRPMTQDERSALYPRRKKRQ